MSRRVAFHTLGCKVNQYDTEAMAEVFRRGGYSTVSFDYPADVYVINTCTVTHESDRKSRQLIRRARRLNPDAVVVVAGCYPQVAPDEARRIDGVDLVIGNQDRGRILELVEGLMDAGGRRAGAHAVSAVGKIFRVREFEELGIAGFSGRTRAPVKVQEGCNEFCTYCIIPYARGRPRSRRPEAVREEVERLAEAGFKEVVLTGIHLGAYGRDLPNRPTLAGLLRLIHDVPGIIRIRISSIEPMDVAEDLLFAAAELPKVCHHLHLPLQSGSDTVLQRMKRRYSTADFRRLVAAARRAMPDVAISTDVIAGFPGEREEDHRATMGFVEEMGFTRLHVFPYSPRAGTPAASFPDQLPPSERDRRARELIDLGSRLSLAYHQTFLGETVEVLGEGGGGEGLVSGHTPHYVSVTFPGPESLVNEVVSVLVEGASAEGLKGRRIGGVSEVGGIAGQGSGGRG